MWRRKEETSHVEYITRNTTHNEGVTRQQQAGEAVTAQPQVWGMRPVSGARVRRCRLWNRFRRWPGDMPPTPDKRGNRAVITMSVLCNVRARVPPRDVFYGFPHPATWRTEPHGNHAFFITPAVAPRAVSNTMRGRTSSHPLLTFLKTSLAATTQYQ